MVLLSHLREMFPWFPKIDVDACRADLQCLNFCPYDVFEWFQATLKKLRGAESKPQTSPYL
jgi:hypothetical protein